jgi:hypothetical protein
MLLFVFLLSTLLQTLNAQINGTTMSTIGLSPISLTTNRNRLESISTMPSFTISTALGL